MSLSQLENLTKTGGLKSEPPDRREFDGLVRSAIRRLADGCPASGAIVGHPMAYTPRMPFPWRHCAGMAIAQPVAAKFAADYAFAATDALSYRRRAKTFGMQCVNLISFTFGEMAVFHFLVLLTGRSKAGEFISSHPHPPDPPAVALTP